MPLPQRRKWDKDIICKIKHQDERVATLDSAVMYRVATRANRPRVEPFHVPALRLRRVPTQQWLAESALQGSDPQTTDIQRLVTWLLTAPD